MFKTELTHDGHSRRFIVGQRAGGWELRVEEDNTVVSRVCIPTGIASSGRSEPSRAGLELEAERLERDGTR